MKSLLAALLGIALGTIGVRPALGARFANCFTKTPFASSIVANIRARIETQCPCAQAPDRTTYLGCARRVIRQAKLDGSLPTACASAVTYAATTGSACGRPTTPPGPYAPCCIPNFAGQNVCLVTSDAACARVPTALRGATSSCYDACPASWTSTCGNGTIERGEACDDGPANGTPGDYCSSTCQLVLPSGCVEIAPADYMGRFEQTAAYQSILAQLRRQGGQANRSWFPRYAMKCTAGGIDTYAARLDHAFIPSYKGHAGPILVSQGNETVLLDTSLWMTPPNFDAHVQFETGIFEVQSSDKAVGAGAIVTMWDLNYNKRYPTAQTFAALDVSIGGISAGVAACNQHADDTNRCMAGQYDWQRFKQCGGCVGGVSGALLAPEVTIAEAIAMWMAAGAIGTECRECLLEPLLFCQLNRQCTADTCNPGTCSWVARTSCLPNDPSAPSPCNPSLCQHCDSQRGMCVGCVGDGHCGADLQCHGCPYP